jgi:hypothetical protein
VVISGFVTARLEHGFESRSGSGGAPRLAATDVAPTAVQRLDPLIHPASS